MAVGHLDASIKLFSPDYDLRTVRAKLPRERNSYFRAGECQRVVLDIFREANGTALSSHQIADRLVQRKCLPTDEEILKQMQRNVLAVTSRLEKIGTLSMVGRVGPARTWRLA